MPGSGTNPAAPEGGACAVDVKRSRDEGEQVRIKSEGPKSLNGNIP
jgi:hypothetical protein